MIKFKQVLREEDYKIAGSASYKRHKIQRIIKLISGIIMILTLIISCLLILIDSIFIFLAIASLIFGILSLCAKKIYLRRLIRNVKSNKNFGEEIDVEIENDGMMLSKQGKDEYKADITKYFGFYVFEAGIMLYPQKSMFFYFKKENMANDDFNKLIEFFTDIGLKKLGKF